MRKIVLAIAACCASFPLFAQPVVSPVAETRPSAPFVAADAAQVIEESARRLADFFVFPEAGKRYAAMLRANLAAGRYNSFADAEEFAKAVTADLQAVHRDAHLRLIPPIPKAASPDAKGAAAAPPRGNGVTRAGWVAPGVAYISFRLFPGNEETLAAVRAFLTDHASAKTLIIDAREHRGGGLDEMDILFPALFAKPKTLVTMDTRVAAEQQDGGDQPEANQLRRVSGPDSVVRREHHVVPASNNPPLADAKVYLLTSRRTASAGEHLSLALKRTGRATLIGETTYGAAHYGGSPQVGAGYRLWVPVGRTFDPDTGESWEAVGVKPHVEVEADKALDEALKLADVHVSGEAALASLN
jgi:hypothetical protein